MSRQPRHEVCDENERCMEIARRELKETPENKLICIQQLKNWILEQSPLLNARTDDFFLLRFLRSSKYDLEKAKQKLSNYYRLRTDATSWFSPRDPALPPLQTLLNIGVFLPLRDLDSKDRLIVVIRTCAHNPAVSSMDDVLRAGYMTLDHTLASHVAASVHGVAAVFDMAGVSLAHARQLTVPMIRRVVHSWQDCYPVRVKSLDFFNSPPYVNVVLNIFKRFMKTKLRERVHVHGYSMQSLHECIDKQVLPEEYGGMNGTLADLQEYWMNRITRNQSWFVDDDKYKYIPEKEE